MPSAEGSRLVLQRTGRDYSNFQYVNTLTTEKVRDEATLKRIRSLGLAPGYRSAMISDNPNSKVQAVCVDSKGRKQFMYHPDYLKKARERKFKCFLQLDAIWNKIQADVKCILHKALTGGIDKQAQIALVVFLLMTTGLRIGNDKYMKDNNTFGLCTMQTSHLIDQGSMIKISLIGKHHQVNKASVTEETSKTLLRRLVHERQRNREARIFNVHPVDVNTWLKRYMPDASSKVLRTHRANKLLVHHFKTSKVEPAAKRMKEAVYKTAADLNHTPAVCKSQYLHPALVEHLLQQ